jgi:purine-binding chemotaxis protein CheW
MGRHGSVSERYVSFLLGTDRYCVPVNKVLQIVRPEGLMAVPQSLSFVAGVINLRGDVVPVVNLKERLGLDGAVPDPLLASRARVVIVRMGNRLCGLQVDEVREIVAIDESAAGGESQADGVRAQFVRAVTQRDGGTFLILDLQHVLGVSRDIASPGLV